MRKIINSTYITLDGVIADPHTWPSTGAPDDELFTIQADLIESCDAVLMGSRTYAAFSAAWPSRSGDRVSDRINSVRKYVVSSTLRKAEWNNTEIIDRDPIAYLTTLKQEPGADIVQYGFGQLSWAMLDHDLLDELRLWLSPVLLRRGGPDGLLYRDGSRPTSLTLVEAKALASGRVVLTYRR
jgi:dihydrofolate reductase